MASNANSDSETVANPTKSRGFFERLFKSKQNKGDGTVKREKYKSIWHKNKDAKVKMLENKNVDGSIKFAVGANTEMWSKIVDNSIVGTKLIDSAVICTLPEGDIIICNPRNYTPSVEQMKCIINGFEDSKNIHQKGFQIVTDVFDLVDADEGQIIGKSVGVFGGIGILKTKSAILIGQWSKRGIDPLNLLKEMKTYLENQGY